MKKILFLIGSLEAGGAEKILVDMVNSIVSKYDDYDVTVQTIVDIGVHKKRLDNRVHYKTIIKSKNKYLKAIKLKLWSKMVSPSYVYNRYVKGDYDYEVAFLEGLPTKIISASKGKKYAWVHINLENSFESLANFKSFDEYKNAYSKFDKVICVSEDVKTGFINKFGEIAPIDVLYNPLDIDEILEKSNESFSEITLWSKDEFNLISVGSLADRKGFDRLVNIAKMLKKDGYKFKIRIAGAGPNEIALKEQISELDVEDCVELLGFKENPFPYIKASDLFVCSSYEEGYSTVVTESLVLETPVITTDCSGMKEQFGNLNCGKIVVNNEKNLYLAIKEYFDNENIREDYKSNALIRSQHFIEKDSLQEIIELFDKKTACK